VREFSLSGDVYSHQTHPILRMRDDGYISIPQTHGVLTLWYEDTRMLVLKERGHREYYNQYNPPFKVPTQFHVFVKAVPLDSSGRFEPDRDSEHLLSLGTFPLNKKED